MSEFWKPPTALDLALDPFHVIESGMIRTFQERQNIEDNLNSDDYKRFYTIYKPEEIPLEFALNFKNTSLAIIHLESDLEIKVLIKSFYRSMQHHLRVYASKGITHPDKIPMKSKHLNCAGIDIFPIGKPIEWLHEQITEEFLEKHDLWQEHEQHTPQWVHLQIQQYPSWKPGKPRKYHI